jgi:hypothetical protein
MVLEMILLEVLVVRGEAVEMLASGRRIREEKLLTCDGVGSNG